MRESSRTPEQGIPISAIALTGLFLLIGLLLLIFFMQPVEYPTRGFGVGPTATLAAPLVPNP